MGKAYTHWPTKMAGWRKSRHQIWWTPLQPWLLSHRHLLTIDSIDCGKSMEIIGTKPEFRTCFESFRGHPVLNGCCLECSAWTRLDKKSMLKFWYVCSYIFTSWYLKLHNKHVNNHFPLPGSTNHRIAWPTCWCQDILHRYTLVSKTMGKTDPPKNIKPIHLLVVGGFNPFKQY